MRWSTRSAGNPKAPTRRLERMTSWVTLSRARPRNPLRSPAPTQRGARLAAAGVGGEPWREQMRTRERPRALRQRAAPGEIAAPVGHLAERELHRRRRPFPEGQGRSVRRALALTLGVEGDLDARVFALGVRGEKVPQPPRHLVVIAAGKHGQSLPVNDQRWLVIDVQDGYPPRGRKARLEPANFTRSVPVAAHELLNTR